MSAPNTSNRPVESRLRWRRRWWWPLVEAVGAISVSPCCRFISTALRCCMLTRCAGPQYLPPRIICLPAYTTANSLPSAANAEWRDAARWPAFDLPDRPADRLKNATRRPRVAAISSAARRQVSGPTEKVSACLPLAIRSIHPRFLALTPAR